MLVRNGRSIFQNPGKFAGVLYADTGNLHNAGFRNRFVGGFSQTFGAYPNGNLAPSAFILPQKAGSISSYTLSVGEADGAGDLIPARNLSASSSLQISVTNAQLDQIVSLLATGSLTIAVSNAALVASAGASASSSMQITVGSSVLGAIFSVTATSNGTITKDAVLTALAYMVAEAGGATPLSPESLAAAVWDTPLVDANTVGSVGEAIKKIETNANLIPAAL